MKKPMQLAVFRIIEIRKPISKVVIGKRLQAAYPNNQGVKMVCYGDRSDPVIRPKKDKKTGEVIRTVSFAKKYLVDESSDYTTIGKDEVKRFFAKLKSYGFTHVQGVRKKANEHTPVIEL